ncbi:unnamed protein product, partial [Musa textilis]
MANNVSAVYIHVLDDVISKVRDEFINYGVGEGVLNELQALWEVKMRQCGAISGNIERSALPKNAAPITPVHDLNVPYEGPAEEYETPTAEMLFPPTPLQTPIQTPLPGTNDPSMYNIPTGPSDYAPSPISDIRNSIDLKAGRPGSYMQPPSPWMSQRPLGVDVNVAYDEGREEPDRGSSHQHATQDFFMNSSGKRKRDDYASHINSGGYIPQQDGSGDVTIELSLTQISDLSLLWIQDVVSQVKTSSIVQDQGTADSKFLSKKAEPALMLPQHDGIHDEYDDLFHLQGVANEDYNTPGDHGKLILSIVSRTKSRWKCTLKDGIMHLNNRDILFNKHRVHVDNLTAFELFIRRWDWNLRTHCFEGFVRKIATFGVLSPDSFVSERKFGSLLLFLFDLMPSAIATASSYWCYRCSRFVRVWPQDPIVCPDCEGGFLEEVETLLPASPHSDESSVAAHPRRPSELRFRRHRRTSAGDRSSFNPVIVLRGRSDGARDADRAAATTTSFELYYDDGTGSGLRPLPESISEFLMGSGFDRLLEQLALVELNGIGRERGCEHPPASKAAIESMPTIEIVGDHIGKDCHCAICMDLFELGTEAREMPCKHIYHQDCILPWLSLRNSCPVCRHEMPTDAQGIGTPGAEGNERASAPRNDEESVGLTIWRLPGGGFAVGRFSGGRRVGEGEFPVVYTEMDGGFNNSGAPRRISWTSRRSRTREGRGIGQAIRSFFSVFRLPRSTSSFSRSSSESHPA